MRSSRISYNTLDILSAILASIPIGVISVDTTGNISLINAHSKKLLDIDTDLEEITGTNISKYLTEVPELSEKIRKGISTGFKSFNLESVQLNDVTLNIKGRPFSDGLIITVENITKLVDNEAESIQYVLEGQENERRRLAKEIHDGIGPLLSAVKLNIESLSEAIEKTEPKATTTLENITEIIDSISNDLRSISHDLMPRLLDKFGLNSAFENLCTQINASGKAEIHFISNMEAGVRFDKFVELNLYRIGQELLHNTLKHSSASEIHFQLIRHKESLVLMIEDNGRGFDTSELENDDFGIGLKNIDTRARALRGDVIIDSKIGRGTSITVEIPL
ncbi:MAG: hypothetical protein JW894_13495 [Bacteroidales bacterium]|nr:hypothetical protein [Bacteroidales bacterium]